MARRRFPRRGRRRVRERGRGGARARQGTAAVSTTFARAGVAVSRRARAITASWVVDDRARGGGGGDVEGGGGEGAKGEIAGRDAAPTARVRGVRVGSGVRAVRGWERTDVRGETFVRGARETGGGEGGGDDEDERTRGPRRRRHG